MKRPERKPGEAPRYLMAGGKGAVLPPDSGLGAPTFLAIADTDGDPREAKIRRAAPLTLSDLEALFPARIREVEICEWSPRDRAVLAASPSRAPMAPICRRSRTPLCWRRWTTG